MKKTKIETMREKVAAKKNAIANVTRETEELELRIDTLQDQATEAANAGDFERYKSLSAEREDAQKELFVKQTYLNTLKGHSVSEDEALEAWNEYAADYDKQFARLLSDYESKRDALLKAYGQLVDLQGEALTVKKDLYDYTGDAGLVNKLKCQLLPDGRSEQYGVVSMEGTGVKNADAVFYMACYEKQNNAKFNSWTVDDPGVKRLNHIISRRIAP